MTVFFIKLSKCNILIFPFSELFFLLILLFFIFYSIWNYESVHLKFIQHKKIVVLFLLFFLIFFIGLFWTEGVVEGLIILKSCMYLLIVPILILMNQLLFVRVLINILISMAVISSLMTILITIEPYLLPIFKYGYKNHAPFINQMYYSIMLTLSLIYLIVNIKLSDKKFVFFFKVVSSLIILTALALMCSRTSVIGFIIVMWIYHWFNLSKLVILKKTLILSLGTIIILVYMNLINNGCGLKFNTMANSFISELQGKRTVASLGCRLNYVQKSLELSKENLYIGVGTGDSIYAMKKFMGENNYIDFVTKPCNLGRINQSYYFDNHNMFLSMLLLFGIIGLVFYLIFLYSLFKIGREINSWELSLSIILVSLASFTITIFYTSSNFVLFFSLFITFIYLRKRET